MTYENLENDIVKSEICTHALSQGELESGTLGHLAKIWETWSIIESNFYVSLSCFIRLLLHFVPRF